MKTGGAVFQSKAWSRWPGHTWGVWGEEGGGVGRRGEVWGGGWEVWGEEGRGCGRGGRDDGRIRIG